MKKLLFIGLLTVMIPSVTSQVVISYWEGYGKSTSEEEFKCDSLDFSKYDGVLYAYQDGKAHIIKNILAIETPNTKENMRILQDIDEYRVKRKYAGQAVGYFATGATMIFLGNIVADAYAGNRSSEDDMDKVRKNTNAIRYTTTGIGAIFEIIGISKMVKLASGSSFSYGIKNDGVTLTYKIK